MWLGHHFQSKKVKGQGHQAALLTAVLVRQVAAAMTWERVGRGKLLLRCRLLGGARRFGAHEGRRGTRAYRGGRPPAYSLFGKWHYVDRMKPEQDRQSSSSAQRTHKQKTVERKVSFKAEPDVLTQMRAPHNDARHTQSRQWIWRLLHSR